MTKEFGPEGDPTSLLVCRMLSNFRRYADLRSPFHPGLYMDLGGGGIEPWTFSGGNRSVCVCVTVVLNTPLVIRKVFI